MPDLARDSVNAWFDRTIGPIRLPADTQSARRDRAELALDLEHLGRALEEARFRNAEDLDRLLGEAPGTQLLQTLIEHLDLRTSACLLAWCAELPGQAALRALLSPSHGSPVLRGRVVDLNRRRALALIFEPARIEELVTACRRAFTDDQP